MTCPDLSTLSLVLDDEPGAPATVRRHVDTCPVCARRCARVRRAEQAARDALHAGRPCKSPPTPACLTPSQVVAWLDPTASAAERRATNEHLDRCDRCLGDALAAAATVARLDRGSRLAVPDTLTARVASRWPAAATAGGLTSLVVAVTRAGAALLERHVAAPFRDLVADAGPLPALRAAADVATLQFELRADGTRIRTTVLPAGDAVSLTIVLVDDAGAPLGAQRVSLQRHGRAVFSARTDDAGQIALPALERGVYEVSCPGIPAAFRLDLRGSA